MQTISITNLIYDNIHSFFPLPMEREIHIDLSQLEFVRPDGIVLLTLLLRQLQLREERAIKISLPNFNEGDYCPLSYLWRIHFFDKLSATTIFEDEDRYKLEQLKNYREHQSTQFTNIIDNVDTSLQRNRLNEIVEVFIGFLRRVKSIKENEVQYLSELLNETFLNLLDHSKPDEKEPPYYCAQIQCYPKRSGMSLVIGDSGVGIKESLNLAHNFNSEKEALKAVIEKRISRFASSNPERGGGIRRIFSLASNLHIHCRLRSGDAEALLMNDGRTISLKESFPLQGTQIFLWK